MTETRLVAGAMPIARVCDRGAVPSALQRVTKEYGSRGVLQ